MLVVLIQKDVREMFNQLNLASLQRDACFVDFSEKNLYWVLKSAWFALF